MGVGSSQERYEPRTGRRSTPAQYGSYGKKKRRRGLFRRLRPTPTTQPVIPIKYHSPHRYAYRLPPYIPPIPLYAPPPSIYPGYMPISYNNYAIPPYALPNQPYMIPLQQMQPMAMPQSQPMMMPQFVPQSQPMIIPQQVAAPMFSPYVSSPYSTGMPMSMPYAQQQPQMRPYFNNVNYSVPVSTGMTGPIGPYSSPYQAENVKLSTDWTGGGKISPGFLGPPI